jgi:phosphatidylserine decarboxylase
MEEIKYFNREENFTQVEMVYGDAVVRWLYNSASGNLLSHILCKAPISKGYGLIQSNSLLSKNKVKPFVQKFSIKLDEYEDQEFKTFNDFFIRKFKPGKRSFTQIAGEMPAFSEARYFGYEEITDKTQIPVKGIYLQSKDLIANEKWNKTFEGGPLMIARLCPVDYHRFHFPDDGEVLDEYRVKGLLHSVNPIALKKKEDIFITNERHVSILKTKNFGKIAYIEVGAICVGKIVQSYKGTSFRRGDEKGYFLFGGSTVIIVGEKGMWKPSSDILNYTAKKMETYIKLGQPVAQLR